MSIQAKDILTISLNSSTLNKIMTTTIGFDLNTDKPNSIYEQFTLFLIGVGIIVPTDMVIESDDDDEEDDGDTLDNRFNEDE